MVEPGRYTLCYGRQVDTPAGTMLESERCVDGMAQAGAVLRLRVGG